MKLASRVGWPIATTLVLCAAAAGLAAALLGPGVGGQTVANLFEVWVLNSVALLSAIVCCVLARRGEERLPWLLGGLAFLCWSAANFYWGIETTLGHELPVPSLADAGWLGFYPLAYASLVLLVRRRVPAGQARWLDGVVTSLTAAALMGILVLDPVVDAFGHKPGLQIGIYLFYGAGDLVLFGLAAGALVVSWNRGRMTWLLLTASYGLYTVADGFYLVRSAQETFEGGTLVSVGWPTSAVLLAVAACLPRSGALDGPEEGWGRALVPSACGVVSIGVLLYATVAHPTPIGPVFAALAVGAVILRLILKFRQNHEMLVTSRGEALRDPLTGLGNRRRLQADFARLRAEGTPLVLCLYDLDGFKEYNDAHGHSAGDALLEDVGRRLSVGLGAHGNAYRFGGDEFCALVDANERTLVADLRDILDDGPLTATCGTCEVPFEASDLDAATAIADDRMYARKPAGRVSAGRLVAELTTRLMDERAPQIAGHSRRVAALAEATGRALDLDAVQLTELQLAATLHDVGTLALPDRLINQPGIFASDEQELMREHVELGEQLLAVSPALTRIADLVRASHERPDGLGYPDGRQADDIPLAAKVIAVCDAFDTMTACRTDRPLLSEAAALDELNRCAGSQFDAAVVEAFERSRRGVATVPPGPPGGTVTQPR